MNSVKVAVRFFRKKQINKINPNRPVDYQKIVEEEEAIILNTTINAKHSLMIDEVIQFALTELADEYYDLPIPEPADRYYVHQSRPFYGCWLSPDEDLPLYDGVQLFVPCKKYPFWNKFI